MASYANNAEIMVDVFTPIVNLENNDSIIEISNLSLEKSSNDTEKVISDIPDEQTDQPIENTSRSLSTENITSDYSDTELFNEEKSLSSLQNEFSANISDSDINEKFKKLEKMYLKSEKLRRLMKTNHKKKERALKNRIKQLQAKVCIIENNPKCVSKLFNVEQLALLNKQYKRMPKWCDNILVKAYQLKFACGVSGYKELLKQGFPLPSLRTLRNKLENWKFKSGDTNEVFEFLKIKVSQFKSSLDKDCLLVIDEISITPGACYDNATGSYIGYVTLPGHDSSVLATHVLVIMLAGIAQRWKQVIDFYYTSKSTDGRKYQSILLNVIKKAHEVGLWVVAITSDMGSSNQAMWNSFNINAHKYSTVMNKCKHPMDDNKYLFFFHDASHAFKNLKEGILNSSTVTIPDDYVQSYSLPTNVVCAQHLRELLNTEQDLDLHLAPKLKVEYLDRSKHFTKMRVKSASHVLSHEVSTVL